MNKRKKEINRERKMKEEWKKNNINVQDSFNEQSFH